MTCDFAIWAVGAVAVPVYETSAPDQIRWELGDSGAVGVFAGNARYANMVRRASPAKVKTIWELDPGGLGKLAEAGKHVAPDEITKRRGAVTSASVATMNGNGATVASCPPDKAAVPKNSCIEGRYTSMAAKASATAMAASGLLLNTPTWRSDARSVRTANAVPTWQATMPSQATVVTGRRIRPQ